MQPKKDYIISAIFCKFFYTLLCREPSLESFEEIKKNCLELMSPKYSDKQVETLKVINNSIRNECFESILLDFELLFKDNEIKFPHISEVYFGEDFSLLFKCQKIQKELCFERMDSIYVQPKDSLNYIAIVFYVLSFLFEKAGHDFNVDSIKKLMQDLLPFIYRFTYLIEVNSNTTYYKSISILIEQFLCYWEEELEIDIK